MSDRVPRTGRRRAAARRSALAVVRELVRARSRTQGRDAGNPCRRERPPQERHPGRQPRRLHRGGDALQHQGRGSRRRVHDAARRSRDQAPRSGRHARLSREDGDGRAQGGGTAGRRRGGCGGGGPPHHSAAGHRNGALVGRAHASLRRRRGGLAVRRHRRAARGYGAARDLRRARRADSSRDRRRRPDAVQQAARACRKGRRAQGGLRREAGPLPGGECLMATTVVMEALSPTMEEGRLVEWKKQEGDKVAVGDVIAEVETDKAVMELVARAAGTLLKQVVAAGATVPVSNPVAIIGEPGEATDATGAPKPEPPKSEAPQAEAPKPDAAPAPAGKTPSREGETGASAPADSAAPAEVAAPAAAPATAPSPARPAAGPGRPEPAPVPAAGAGNGGTRVKASPLARKIAADRGLDLQ